MFVYIVTPEHTCLPEPIELNVLNDIIIEFNKMTMLNTKVVKSEQNQHIVGRMPTETCLLCYESNVHSSSLINKVISINTSMLGPRGTFVLVTDFKIIPLPKVVAPPTEEKKEKLSETEFVKCLKELINKM